MNLPTNLIPVMNNTKWDELRMSMYNLKQLSPAWRTKCWENGYISKIEGDWFYYFRKGGYEYIEWVEIYVHSKEQKNQVISELTRMHLPTKEITNGFRVYGYIQLGEPIEYAKLA